MGAEVSEMPRSVTVKALKLEGTHIRLPFPSVGATENLLLAAVLAQGTTVIHNAAVEPDVLDTVHFLQQMGALVTVEVDRTILVEGVDRLRGTTHRPINDRIEAASFGAAAVATGGRVEVRGARGAARASRHLPQPPAQAGRGVPGHRAGHRVLP